MSLLSSSCLLKQLSWPICLCISQTCTCACMNILKMCANLLACCGFQSLMENIFLCMHLCFGLSMRVQAISLTCFAAYVIFFNRRTHARTFHHSCAYICSCATPHDCARMHSFIHSFTHDYTHAPTHACTNTSTQTRDVILQFETCIKICKC